MLNVGVLGGHSLRMYSDFFGPDSTIVGVDIDLRQWRGMASKPGGTRPNIQTIHGNASAPHTVERLRARFRSFHLIVDDGCHMTGCQVPTARALFPLLLPGGMYIIEDVHDMAVKSRPPVWVSTLVRSLQRKRRGGAATRDALFAAGNLSAEERMTRAPIGASQVETVLFGQWFVALTKYQPHARTASPGPSAPTG